MQLDPTNRTACVTGASAGIGAAIARSLDQEGVRLAVTARRSSPLTALAADLEAAGAPRVTVIPADITSAGGLAAIVAAALDGLGQVDVLVNCAGASHPLTLEADDAARDEAHALNFTASPPCARRAALRKGRHHHRLTKVRFIKI